MRHRSTRIHSASSAAAALLLCLGVEAGCGPSTRDVDSTGTVNAAAATGGTLVCGSYPVTDDQGNTYTQPEYYLLTSINRKLRQYPEFAAVVGMSSVTNCAEAREYNEKYQEYFDAHPFFDRGLSLDPRALRPPVHAETGGSQPEVAKIFNGVRTGPGTGAPLPVVSISFALPANTKWFNGQNASPAGDTITSCTGTFIAKNFILTAAHCFADLALQYDPSHIGSQLWVTDAFWAIQWADASGVLATSARVRAVSIVDPSFSGVAQPRVYPEAGAGHAATLPPYDVGLLWIDSTNSDGFGPVNFAGMVPPSADKSTWAVQFEDERSLLGGWSLTAWGYGSTDGVHSPGNVLNANSNRPAQSQGSTALFQTVFDGTAGTWAGCANDSGGPLTRQVTQPNGTVDTVIVAVHSAAQRTGLCGNTPNNVSTWARVDVAQLFITDIVQNWENGQNFVAPVFADGSGHPQSYIKLHGHDCQSDCDCSPTQYCDNPATFLSTACPTCGPSGDCSCVLGQCLESANPPSTPRACGTP